MPITFPIPNHSFAAEFQDQTELDVIKSEATHSISRHYSRGFTRHTTLRRARTTLISAVVSESSTLTAQHILRKAHRDMPAKANPENDDYPRMGYDAL